MFNDQGMPQSHNSTFISEVAPGKKLRVLSLFSGCGGMDLGLEGGFIAHSRSVGSRTEYISEHVAGDWVRLTGTPFTTVFANDIFSEAKRVWDANRYVERDDAGSVYRLGSIVDLVRAHEQGEGVFPEDIDVVTGGFPCQDFSVAGKRLGFNSDVSHTGERMPVEAWRDEESEATRGRLYHWMKRVIDIVRPRAFIAENVKGLVNFGDVLEIIRGDFSRAGGDGYIVVPPQVLNSADYGVAQRRERVLFIGFRRDALRPEIAKVFDSEQVPPEYSPYPWPTHNFTNHDGDGVAPLTVGEIFRHLQEPEESGDLSQRYYSKARFLANGQGQKEVVLTDVGMTIRSEHHGNIEFRRLGRARGGVNLEELAKGYVERRMTPRECALIQSFPPDHSFVLREGGVAGRFSVSPSAAYKMIGNAVPPVLAYHMGRRLASMWEEYFK